LRPLLAYCVAGATLLFALGARVLLDPVLGDMQVFVTLYAAVAVAVWVGGWGAAGLVAVLGYAAAHMMFLEPRGVVDFSETRTVVGMMAFLATCSLIIVIGEAMRAAQRRTSMFAKLVENSTDFIGICDLGFVPLYVNRAGLKMVGLGSIQEARRALVKDFFLPEDQARIMDEFFPAVKERGWGETEVRFRHFPSNETRWMAYKVIALTDAAERTIAYATVSQDITERRRLEDNLCKLAADLSEADRRKNEFLATLAHELRNPLAPLRSTLDILKRTSADQAMLPQVVEMMDRQLAQLIRLVDDLLDLSRITQDRLELRKDYVPIRAVLQQAVQACDPLAASLGHALNVVLPPESTYVHADGARLTQVFANLLHNSCKYTPAGGTVSVIAERQEGDFVVTVEDNGVGIPPDRLETVFGMFEQLDRTLAHSQGGLGLGLPLVRHLVQMHGGMVQAKSPGAGLGSRFIVRLPLADPAAMPALAAPSSEAPVPARRILVVDDNRDAASALAMMLRMGSHEVHVAHDGAQALEAAEQHRPEVVLLDIGLPLLNGYEVCMRMRDATWGKAMTIIALTGWGQAEDQRKSREAGFDSHLVKPASHAAIEALLRQKLAERIT
jgi:PAS domain S-box-containing protein